MLAVTSTSIWYTMRATGVVALVLLTGTMILGILTAGRTASPSWPGFARVDLHKRVSLLAMVFLALHVLTAVLDTYVSVGWASAVIPFASPYRPLWTGLGTVGVDLMVAVAVSSALRQRISPRTWRGIHWLAYGSWPVAMAHSLGMGTDATTLWFDTLAGVCTVAVAGALTWRIVDHRRSKVRARVIGATTRVVPVRAGGGGTGPQPVGAGGAGGAARSSRPTSIGPTGPISLPTPTNTPTATRLLERDRP
jgi:methionine sulfoxide reductase heme-binding subunit